LKKKYLSLTDFQSAGIIYIKTKHFSITNHLLT